MMVMMVLIGTYCIKESLKHFSNVHTQRSICSGVIGLLFVVSLLCMQKAKA